MSSRTYVCVRCRWARRADAAYGLNTNLRCPTCHGSLWELEWRWRIPRKSNVKGWKDLESKIARASAAVVRRRQQIGAEKVARLDRQIAEVERQRNSPKKAAKLRNLRSVRSRVVKNHA
jgi:hypothetical protein